MGNSTSYRPVSDQDYEGWKRLFEGYCTFYGCPQSEQRSKTIWRWLKDPTHMFEGIVAHHPKLGLVGLAHFHARPHSLSGCETCYLSDLFVGPDARGQKIGEGLYKSVMRICRERGWPTLNLLTQHSNLVAQGLYDQFGSKTDFFWYATPID